MMPSLRDNKDVDELWVEIDLGEQIGDKNGLVTRRLPKLSRPFDFDFRYELPVAPGSAEEASLRAVVEAADEQESDVYFELKSTNSRGEEVSVGQGFTNLKKVLTERRDISNARIAVKGRKGESLGSLTISLSALNVLENATGVPPPTAPAGARAQQSSASRFVGSFGGAPAAAAPAASPARAVAQPARAVAQPARAVAQPARAVAQPARAVGSPGGAGRSAASQFVATSPKPAPAAAGGAESVLSFRLEALTLAGGLQRDPSIRSFFLSLRVLGVTHNTPDLRRVSPPIKVNHSIDIEVPEGSPEQQDLKRAMQFGAKASADVPITLNWYDPSSSGGGDEPEQLAAGVINLRQLWEGRRELTSHRVQLRDDEQEVTTLTISTSIMRALERVMSRR